MAMRRLTGMITRADGAPFTGTLRVTPLEQIVVTGANVAVVAVEFAVIAGALPPDAALVVPGTYEFALLDGADELQCFQAPVGEGLAPVSLFDLYTTAYGPPPVIPGPACLVSGSSILLLAPGGGSAGQVLGQSGGALAWTAVPAGDWSAITGRPATFPPDAHTHANATTGAAGFMSAADKAKLDGSAARIPSPYVFNTQALAFAVNDMHASTTPAEFNESVGHGGRMMIDLTNAVQLRLNLAVVATNEPAGCVASAQFSTDNGANWSYFDVGALNAALNTTGGKLTGWAGIPAQARGDVLVRIVGYNGTAGGSCSLGMVRLDVR
ncbi:MAG TPA: hypothetical protein VHI13_15195 [Candidatus Kapabacteria bacterium]|nr:hypothetical protein [Candidatus Kapabacteria bacterium]